MTSGPGLVEMVPQQLAGIQSKLAGRFGLLGVAGLSVLGALIQPLLIPRALDGGAGAMLYFLAGLQFLFGASLVLEAMPLRAAGPEARAKFRRHLAAGMAFYALLAAGHVASIGGLLPAAGSGGNASLAWALVGLDLACLGLLAHVNGGSGFDFATDAENPPHQP